VNTRPCCPRGVSSKLDFVTSRDMVQTIPLEKVVKWPSMPLFHVLVMSFLLLFFNFNI